MSVNLFNSISRKPVCFVLIGPPACGKTTYRERLRERYTEDNYPVVISGDDLIEAECARTGLTYDEVFRTVDFKEQKRMLREAFFAAVDAKRDIVIDRTNMSVKSRRSFLASLPATYEKVGVVFEFEMDALMERAAKRGRETGKSIGPKVYEQMLAAYQPPADGEFHRVERFNSFV